MKKYMVIMLTLVVGISGFVNNVSAMDDSSGLEVFPPEENKKRKRLTEGERLAAACGGCSALNSASLYPGRPTAARTKEYGAQRERLALMKAEANNKRPKIMAMLQRLAGWCEECHYCLPVQTLHCGHQYDLKGSCQSDNACPSCETELDNADFRAIDEKTKCHESCTACFEHTKPSESFVSGCGKLFHAACMERWSSIEGQKRDCPACGGSCEVKAVQGQYEIGDGTTTDEASSNSSDDGLSNSSIQQSVSASDLSVSSTDEIREFSQVDADTDDGSSMETTGSSLQDIHNLNLAIAICCENVSGVGEALAQGADFVEPIFNGKTAIQLANDTGNEEIIQALREHAAAQGISLFDPRPRKVEQGGWFPVLAGLTTWAQGFWSK